MFDYIHSKLYEVLKKKNIEITGAFHIGAHDCEEIPFYEKMNLSTSDIIWIDALESKVNESKAKGIPNVYHAMITDKDDEELVFNISNNVQSSSIYELGTHLTAHPWVHYVDKISQKSITVDSFFKNNNIDASKYNFWNFDIQGAELLALKGAINSIQYAKVIYLEVNEKFLYKNCALVNEIDSFLEQYNFKRVETQISEYGWGDAFYIRD